MLLISKKIVNITKNEPEKVYDIQTAKNNNFFANNTLVHNCILYQESLQLIYHILAGMPLDETDMVRKAFTKKDIANKEKAKADRQKLKEEFITRCKAANNIDEKLSEEIFEDLEKYVSYSFNKSHAVSYSVLSYQTSWLLYYFMDEWITSYIDYCATEKGKLTDKEDPKSVAIREAMELGYKLGKPDINASGLGYMVKKTGDVKELIPSFVSLKGIGSAAAEEVMKLRLQGEDYTDVYSLLLTKQGEWKHSKFNKSALGSLIKIEALTSMNIVGEDKPIKNYKHLYQVVIENFDAIKRYHARKNTTSADVINFINELIEKYKEIEDWEKEEKKDFQLEIIGQYDLASMYDQSVFDKLEDNNVLAIDDYFEAEIKKPKLCWFLVKGFKQAFTKNEKPYVKMKVVGKANQQFDVFFWGAVITYKNLPKEGDLMVCTLRKSDMGFSSNDAISSSIVSREIT